MATGTDPLVSFSFESKAMAPETFKVAGFEGTEEISRPYRFEIGLVAENPDIDLEQLLLAPATLAIEKGDGLREIHGVVSECRLSDALPDHRYRYQVVLRPRIWLLSLSRQNQIYQEMSTPEIVSEEIMATGAKGATQHAKAGLFGDDFEMRLTRKYARREYIVQYQESDLAFVSRLMEHEGLFYFFEQGDAREKMVITDNNVHFADLADREILPYRPESGLAHYPDEAILSLVSINRRVPRKIMLKDYNYRLPHVMLQADAEVDAQAHGLISTYGDHFKTPEQGLELARIRAQELRCTKQVFKGSSDSIRLQPGCRFMLEEHFCKAMNRRYVVTRIDHTGRRPLAGAAGVDPGRTESVSYGNRIHCIPAEVEYRPPRRTPKPKIGGLLNAHVDSALLEDRAEIDRQGRYKLLMPFDLSGAAAGKASRYVRKAQPYGGRDMGMHFPLHKGTEVICSFVNGDPDRPIITGVVPNPLTASVVSETNHTKNVLKTASGAFLEFNDGAGKAAGQAAEDNGRLAPQQQMQCVASQAEPPPARRGLIRQQQFAANDTFQESDPAGGNDKWFRVKVPDYADSKDSYLRLGASVSEEVLEQRGQSDDAIVMTYDASPSDQNPLVHVSVNCMEGNRIELNPLGIPDDPDSKPIGISLRNASCGAMIDDDGHFKVIAPAIQQVASSTPATEPYSHSVAAIEVRYDIGITTIEVELKISKAGNLYPDGWFDFTSGDRTSITVGNKEERVMTEEKGWCTYEGVHKVGGVTRKVTLEHTSAFSGAFGDEESYFGGSKIEGFVGLKNEISLASSLEAYTGFKFETHLDWNFEIGTQGTVNLVNGNEYTLVDEQQTYGTEIKLHVVEKDLTPTRPWTIIHVLSQLLGTGVVAGLAGAKSALHRTDTDGTHIAGDVTEWSTHGAFALGHALLLAWSLARRRKIKAMERTANAVTQLNLTKDETDLMCGKAGIKLFADGGVLIFGKKLAFAYESPSGYHPGLTMDDQGITVHKGGIDIQAGKLTAQSDIETKSGQLKSQTFTSPPLAPAPPADSAGQMKGKRQFGPVITKALQGLRRSGPFETI
jgi:type VI secretion system VgrG family protein